MCGIVGYIGKSQDIRIGLDALKRLEYRGYDSAGLAVFSSEKKEITCLKSAGRISLLEKKIEETELNLNGNPSIFHTRWATHGGVTDANAHPHWDCQKNIFLVHNGIIENFQELKDELIAEGHKFNSECDTEVFCHLIEKYFKGNLEEAVSETLRRVRGAYAIAVIARDDPQKIVVARLSSPLSIGVNDQDYLIASDQAAIVPYTRKIINLNDYEMATITPEKLSIFREPEEITFVPEEAEKGGYPHFMLKEIMEQPESLENTLRGRLILETGQAKLGGLEMVKDKLKTIKRLFIVACGTAHYMTRVGEYMLEEYAGIPTEVDSGFRISLSKTSFR